MSDSAIAPALVIRDHLVDGLFVKEVASAAPGGPETPLLFVHGAAHGWWAWEKWLGFFAAAGWRCYAMSLRNHTGSRAVPEPEYLGLRVADYAEDVGTVARWLDGTSVLIGHSMGGIAAQKAAESLDLRGMVLVASVGPGQLGRIRDPLPEDHPITYDAARAREQWFRDIDDASLARIHARLVPESPGVVNDYSGGVPIERDRIACPVLVIGAACDRTVVHPARAIARFYGCSSLIVPEAAHDLMLEKAALPVAIRLNQWLLEVADQPRLEPIAIVPAAVKRA